MHDRKAAGAGQKPRPFSIAERLKGRQGESLSEGQCLAEESVPPAIPPSEGDSPAQLLYLRARKALEDFFKIARSLRPCDPSGPHGLARSMVDNVLADWAVEEIDLISRAGQSLFLRSFHSETEASDFIDHTIGTTILAATLGVKLERSGEDLVRLTLASLLHNVGMLFLVPTILSKRGGLWPDERASIQKHSEVGAKFVRGLGVEYGAVAEIIHQVHEREGGQGYPLGLAGSEIHEDAKIIGIADVYTALTLPRPHRRAFPPFQALQEIIQNMEGQFAPHPIKALWEVFSIFLVGSFVKLNTDWVGRVKEAKGCAPMRPVVELLLNAAGERLHPPPRTMNLTEQPEVYIKGIVSKERVKRILGADVY